MDWSSTPADAAAQQETSPAHQHYTVCPGCQVDLCDDCADELEAGLIGTIDLEAGEEDWF
jgi:hypothetical protein